MPNAMRQQAIAGLKAGDSFTYTRKFTQAETTRFGEMTRDYNPVHYDNRWTAAKGFKGLICHGLLVGSMLCEFGGQVGWLATGMNFNFVRPVFFGDTITCAVTIVKISSFGRAEAEALFTNDAGETVCHAHMTGRLPQEQERRLLEQMVTEGDPTNPLNGE